MRKRIFHGWYVVVACFLCMLVAAGIGWFTFPVFIKPLENEFGWSRTQITGAVGLWAAVTGISSPILGHWVDRLGARWVILAGVVGGGLCSMALAEIHTLGHLYFILLFAAVGTAASTYMPVASVISQWFVSRRGLAMSLAMVGMGMGGFVMPNVANLLIENMGWRWSYRLLAIITWVSLIPPVFFWVRKPEELGLKPYGVDIEGANARDPAVEEIQGFSARQALTMRSFWGIGIADLFNATAFVGILVNMVAFSIDSGIKSDVAAFAYSSVNAVAMVGIIAVGAAADRFDRRVLLSVSYALPAVAVLFLLGLKSPGPLFCYAILCGFCSAGHATLWPLVVSDCFGKRAYATVMGFLSVFYVVGTGIGPPLAGFVYDTMKSYHWVFVSFIAAFAISGVAMAVGTKSRFEGP